MKRYNITVNGVEYDVAVEEADAGGDDFSIPRDSSIPKSAPKPASAPKRSTGAQGAVKINAPMPGTILDIKAKPGEIKKGAVIAVLEAMKMENDIVAPQDGVLVSINVAKGESVNTGTVVATMN